MPACDPLPERPANPPSYKLFRKETLYPASSPDIALAFRWAEKAAVCGCSDAKASLAHLCAHGPDAQRDLDRSNVLYRESAEQGSPKGAFGYGMLLLRQPSGATAGDQAAHWIRTAADAGVPLADYIYGYMCEHGIRLLANLVEAATFYKRLA